MSDRALLDAFARACAHAGLSNSGLTLDPLGPGWADEARYLKGVVLARLGREKPPFKQGVMVQPKSK
ncbi:MAG: hypothetical protein Q7S76_00110, partial [bacterium]|nr:hypothetical protein [bacterium]